MLRIGLGYDIHKLEKNRDLILGGVKIPFELGLLGHSDADVLIHAIIDSILGSVALGDIGSYFPDTDNNYKNIDSSILLKKTVTMLKNKGYRIINIDSNIICQKPKLAPYIDKIRENLACFIEIPKENISVKAKTNEKQDSIGLGAAIAAQAVVLVESI